MTTKQPSRDDPPSGAGRDWPHLGDETSSDETPGSAEGREGEPLPADAIMHRSDGGEASDVEGQGATYRGGG
jgi:hypothetical protein